MKKLNFLRSALAIAALAGSQFAMADIGAGSRITFKDGVGSGNGGAFKVTVIGGTGMGETFESFCLEKSEFINFSSTFYVKGLTGQTTTSGTPDPLSEQAAWLFTQFKTNAVTFFGANLGDAGNTALQQAIWKLEGEQSTANALATSYITAANTAVNGGWKNNGSVKVMNLFSDAAYTKHAQDQIYMVTSVPEPETYALMLAGLGLVGAVARRRSKAKTA